MASGAVFGFSMGGLGGFAGSSGGTLGEYIREAQLSDFLYSFGGPRPKAQVQNWDPGTPARTITASSELPGPAHYIPPSEVPVGETVGGGAILGGIIRAAGVGLPSVVVRTPDVVDEGQPPIIFSPAPIILPGQVDPGREEQESEEGPMAHTWTHVGSQFIGALFPNTVTQQAFVAGPGAQYGGTSLPTQSGAGLPAPSMTSLAGSCPPAKTRTLTIDCATGLEIKRKRRRRRALLTQGDMGVLFQIASLPNSANVRVALAGAIRR